MSPAEIIERATEDGVLLALSLSGSISAKGVRSAIDRWLPAIRQSKGAIVTLLRPGTYGWSAADWQALFDERAGIAEFDGGLRRVEAKARAFAWCVVEWLNRNLERSPPAPGLVCGDRDHTPDPLLPHCIEPARHAWLHWHCCPACHVGREAEAVAAPTAMGITPPTNFPNDFGKNGDA